MNWNQFDTDEVRDAFIGCLLMILTLAMLVTIKAIYGG